MRPGLPLFLLGTLLCLSPSVSACEPILPLMQLFTGFTMTPGSLGTLGAVCLVKSLVFAFSERQLPRQIGLAAMLGGNVVSSAIGYWLALGTVTPPAILIALPVLYIFSRHACQRFVALNTNPKFSGWRPTLMAVAVTVLYLLTFVLFGVSQVVLRAGSVGTGYWLAKLGYVLPALVISIGLSTLWEEWTVARLTQQLRPGGNYIRAAFRANLVALALAMGIAATEALPKRLASPDFLLPWD